MSIKPRNARISGRPEAGPAPKALTACAGYWANAPLNSIIQQMRTVYGRSWPLAASIQCKVTNKFVTLGETAINRVSFYLPSFT